MIETRSKTCSEILNTDQEEESPMHRPRSLFKNYAETSLSVVRHAERVAKVSLAEAGVRTVWMKL